MDEQSETKVVETTQIAPQNNAIAPNQPESRQNEEESPQQIDWKKFKEARKVERQQKEEAEKRANQKSQEAEALKAALEALVNRPQQQAHQETEESDDDRIQKKIDQALTAERKRVEEERVRREHAEFPQRLTANHPDFDSVCTSENLDYLEYHYPEVASAFKNAPDGFEKWSNIYKAIKRFIPNTSGTKDQKKAEKNFIKPQSMSVAGVTQTGDESPKMLDDKRKQDNWTRMQRRMKGLG